MANGMSPHRIRIVPIDGGADVRALIQHPMETGTRKDPVSGKTIPRHFIQELSCEHSGIEVMHAYWSWGMAINPFLSIHIQRVQAGDVIRVRWIDNTGLGESLEGVVQ
jgi:sulfur-oxidizing protein SoxZ